jgi:hypothetical protein
MKACRSVGDGGRNFVVTMSAVWKGLGGGGEYREYWGLSLGIGSGCDIISVSFHQISLACRQVVDGLTLPVTWPGYQLPLSDDSSTYKKQNKLRGP